MILGMDHIKSLNFDQNNDFITLNGVNVQRADTRYGQSCKMHCILPKSSNKIKIKNPFPKWFGGDVLIEGNLDTNGFQISPFSHTGCDELTLIVSNLTTEPLMIFPDERICKVIIHDNNSEIHALEMIDTKQENLDALEFQKSRKLKYCTPPRCPEIGKIGNLDKVQNAQLIDLLTKNSLAFSWETEDLGKCHGFRFTLPLIKPGLTAFESPRPIPPAQFPLVEEEIKRWLQLAIIQETQSTNNSTISPSKAEWYNQNFIRC